MRRIDAHQHFWVYNESDYVWMGPEHGAIRRDFLPEHLSPLLESIGSDWPVCTLAGAYFNWLLVAGRLRAMSEKLKAVTLPTFISNRFDDKSGVIKIVSTLVILFFFTLYVASGLKGGTLLFAHTFGATESLSPRSSSRSCWIAAVPRARRIGISWMAVSLIMATTIGIIGTGVHAAVFFQHSFEANLEAAWEGEASHFFDALRGELELVSAALVVRGS